MAARKSKPPRQRRDAETARREILDAVEARLRQSGPAALRIADVAADVGVSHPAVLHHFGNREELIRAAITRAVDGLQSQLVEGMAQAKPDADSTLDVIGRLLDGLERKGYARMLAWIVLSGLEPETPDSRIAFMTQLVHEKRCQETALDPPPTLQDTRKTVLLIAYAAFGQAIFGDFVLRSSGVSDVKTEREAFRRWLADLVHAQLVGSTDPT